MANINQVKHWLKAGKKVRRPIWDKESYWVLSTDGFGRILYSDGTAASVHLLQLEEIDWELYEDEKTVKDILIKVLNAGREANNFKKGYVVMYNKLINILDKIGNQKIKW